MATNGNNVAQTNNYQVVIPPAGTITPTYDTVGEMTSNGNGQSYQWDAENRLVKITQGSSTYQFGYDAFGRRITETDNSTLAKQWIWSGATMAEERNASNSVTKRFYPQGEQISGSSYYYTFDHLGSIRELTNSGGTIQARYDYDPFGRVTLVSGTNLSDFQYAGYYAHQASGLNLTMYRAYDPNTAKWLSRDPMPDAEMYEGPNLYDYVSNDPVDLNDPLGLCCSDDCKAKAQQALRDNLAEAAAIGAGIPGVGQTANKSGTKFRGGVAGGGSSGSYTSYTRGWTSPTGNGVGGSPWLGRMNVPIVAAGGAAVGVATLELIVLYYYEKCMSQCK